MGRKYSLLAVGVLVFLFMASVCHEVFAAAAAPAKHRTIRMMQPSEPLDQDLFQTHQYGGKAIDGNVIETLVDVGKKGEPIPVLATKWKQMNPTTWRLDLRKGVKFHNGAGFTASDVVESAKAFLAVKDVSTIYPLLPIEKVVAVNDYTVDISFKEPYPFFLLNLHNLSMYQADAAKEIQNSKGGKLFPAVGTGPYKFVQWEKGQNMKFTRFEGYWGKKPPINDMEITFRKEAGVRLAALQAGEADWVSDLTEEQASSAPKVVSIPSDENYALRLDEGVQKNAILADKRIRLAIDLAIKRSDLVALFVGLGVPLQGQFGKPGDFGYNAALKYRPYDLAKAKALVKEAGAIGKTITFGATAGRWPKDREVSDAIVYMIGQTGLNVKFIYLQPEETKKWNVTTGKRENPQFMTDIMFSSYDNLLEIESRYSKMLHKDGMHYAGNDPKASQLFDQVLAENDTVKRGKKLAAAWAYNYEQIHIIPLIKPPSIWGLSKNLKWDPDIMGRPFLRDFQFTN